MSFLVSPGVEVNEIDLTNIIPAVSTSIGAYAGRFNWGPVDEVVNLSSEKELARNFGTPTKTTAESFFTAATYLRYGRTLLVSRAINADTALNAASDGTGALIRNTEDYEVQTASSLTANFYAKYPGSFGNSLKVMVQPADTEARFAITDISVDSAEQVVVTVNDAGQTLANGVEIAIRDVEDNGDLINKLETTRLWAGDVTAGSGDSVLVTLYTDSSTTTPFDATNYTDTIISTSGTPFLYGPIETEDFEQAIINAPGTSEYAAKFGAANDEIHVLVIDEDGRFTGQPGTILERFENVSVASDAKKENGATNYYKTIINTSSRYIIADNLNSVITGADDSITEDGTTSFVSTFADGGSVYQVSLTGGVDGSSKDGVVEALEQFTDSETLDVNLLFAENDSNNSITIANKLIQVAEKRKDCIAFVSCDLEVKDQATEDGKLDKVLTKFNKLTSTSYAVFDSSPLYVYNKYADEYIWVPASGSMAGLCARTDETRDPWFSPAGYNRGQLLGVAKLGFNPKQNARDELYKARVNPIVSFPGQGILLFGDKTGLSRPSAFDRINVRRLFIVLEKAISTASKFSLFELNDEFTRAQFRNLVEPFLRDVQGRRGITDFLVVCDETNNTGQVIDSNRFVADIYIKPARSINFITLNFIATRTGVEFNEIVGQF